MGSIFIKEQNGAMKELDPIRCTSETREVQDLLDENLSLIPGDQIKPANPCRWLMIKREMPIQDPNSGEDRWSLDFVVVDQSAMLTLVECKIHKDTRSRREVVGQVFEYVANAQFYWTADFLKVCAEETAKQKGTTLDAMLKGLQPDEDLEIEGSDDFFAQAISNLKEGSVRLIFFFEDAPRELKSIVDFLNQQMKRTEVLVVEAKQYVNGQSRVIVPSLFGYTEQARISKETVRVRPANSLGRRKWNESLFFEDAEAKKLSSTDTASMRALYEFSQTTAEFIDWGTGMQRGSFNPKYPVICPRSPFTLFSDGNLQLNFGWLNGSDASTSFRDLMFNALTENKLFDLKPDALDKFPAFSATVWAKNVQIIINVLREVLKKQRETSVQAPDAL